MRASPIGLISHMPSHRRVSSIDHLIGMSLIEASLIGASLVGASLIGMFLIGAIS
jgi:hypothetical protein